MNVDLTKTEIDVVGAVLENFICSEDFKFALKEKCVDPEMYDDVIKKFELAVEEEGGVFFSILK